MDKLTPKRLQILSLLILFGNIILILILGFKLVQFYSLIIGALSIFQIFVSSYFYKSPDVDEDYNPPVSVIVPAYNEEDTISETLKSCVNSGYPLDKLELITVNDGSNDMGSDGKSRTLSLMYETRNQILKDTDFKIKVLDLGQNFGKREAMVRGFLNASRNSKIFITVDADSYVQKGAIQKLVNPFKDKKVGAVSGNTEIANPDKLLTRIQNYMYWTSYKVFKSSESFFGNVMCCPGCFSAFREKDIWKVIGHFRNENFCNVSEDRNLTNHILNLDKEIVYRDDAVVKTNAPEKLSQFIKQQYRWKISTIYENIFVVTNFINRKHPFTIINFFVSFILIFSWSIAAIYAIFSQIITASSPWTVLFWFTCMPVLPLYWAIKEKKIQYFGIGFLSIYLWMFIIDSLNYFALANLNTEKWEGKDKPQVESKNSSAKGGILKIVLPIELVVNAIRTRLNQISWPHLKNSQTILSITLTVLIIAVIVSSYYVNLRIPVTYIFAYILSFVYYVSPIIYIGLSNFFSNYWIGMIGMFIFGVGGSRIIQKISIKNKNKKSLKEIAMEIYPGLDGQEREGIIKNCIPALSNQVLYQNDTIASPLYLLLNLPYIGKYLQINIQKTYGNLLIKPITWVVEILTMLILYRFFLRHFLLPMNMSSRYLTGMIGEEKVKQIMVNDVESEEKKSKGEKLLDAGHIISLKSFLNYFDHKILEWSAKKREGSILWGFPLGCVILVRAITSLVRQRVFIAFIASYIAVPIVVLLFPHDLINQVIVDLPVPLSGFFPVTVALVITSFIVVFFLEIPRMKYVWDKNRKKFNKKKALLNSSLISCSILAGSTLSMVLIGPELAFAISLTAGIPLLGETVRFMEEFIYGANGQGGIGAKIISGIEDSLGIRNPDPIQEGWDKPAAWKIESNGQGVMPESKVSLRIDGQGEAFSHLISVANDQSYVLQFMADTRSNKGSIDVSIEEFQLEGTQAKLINRIPFGSVDGQQGIDYITNNYKPSSSNVDAVRVSIEGNNDTNIKGYVDGVRLSRVTNSPATNELKKPHVILRFDDGWKNQALPEMKTDDYGYPAVYNIIPDVLPDDMTTSLNDKPYMSLQEAYKLFNQNQIGTHSGGYKNDDINSASKEKILIETMYQFQILNILGFKTDTYASPNFLYNADSLRIIYRTFNSHQIDINDDINAYKFPFNRYKLYTIEPVQVKKEIKPGNKIFEDPGLMNIDDTKNFIDSAVKNNATPVLMFHVINKAGDAPKSKLEMETTAYNDLLDYIHKNNIPVISFNQLLALQEESLSDLPLNSFDGNGIKKEEGDYYPMGSIKLVDGNGTTLQDYITDEDVQPFNVPFIDRYPMLDDILQTYPQTKTEIFDSSSNVSIVNLAVATFLLTMLKGRKDKENRKKK